MRKIYLVFFEKTMHAFQIIDFVSFTVFLVLGWLWITELYKFSWFLIYLTISRSLGCVRLVIRSLPVRFWEKVFFKIRTLLSCRQLLGNNKRSGLENQMILVNNKYISYICHLIHTTLILQLKQMSASKPISYRDLKVKFGGLDKRIIDYCE